MSLSIQQRVEKLEKLSFQQLKQPILKVIAQSDFDALPSKNPNILYIIT